MSDKYKSNAATAGDDGASGPSCRVWGLLALDLRLVVVLVALLPGTLRQGCGWILYDSMYVYILDIT